MIGASPPLARSLDLIRRAALTDVPVLVQGGTGKELVCRAIHELGPPEPRPFVSVNCAAISPSLVESELFGHEKGAFTGRARPAHRSLLAGRRWHAAARRDQRAAARQSGEAAASAARAHVSTRGRRSRATHLGSRHRGQQSRLACIGQGRSLRADLYYRLNVLLIDVPPLRARSGGNPAVAAHFRARCEAKWQRRLLGFEPASLERPVRCDWQGNVRELEHAVERAVLLCDGAELIVELDELGAAPATDGPAAPADLSTLERQHILSTLDSVGYRVSGPKGAAARLGMHPNTLRYRMAKLGIGRPR
jgi:transcriptional regulator with GAF, ATPase, and Fis domain